MVEVMGRYAGWIALNAGMASGVHAILIPEIPFSLEPVAALITHRERHGAKFSIVCVAEGARPVDGEVSIVGKCLVTCCGVVRLPRSTGCSACASAPLPCGPLTKDKTV